MKKRSIALLLLLALLLFVAACGADSKEPVESPQAQEPNLSFEELYDWPEPTSEDSFAFDPTTGAITSYVGAGGIVRIPEAIGGTAVTAIGENCFYDESGERNFEDAITALYIPDSVKTIGTYAFVNNQFLEVLRLPAGLEEIPRLMCYLCQSLREITIPDTVKIIGSEAFSVSGLESLRLPAGLEVIDKFAFSNCAQLALPELPEGLKTIGEKAFSGCAWTPYYTIPESVQSIGSRAFENTVFGLNFPGVYAPADLPELDNSGGPVFETVQLALLAWDVTMEQVLEMDEYLLSIGEGEIAWAMFNPEWQAYVDYGAMSHDESGTVTGFDYPAGTEGLKVGIPREDEKGEIVLTAIGESAFESHAAIFVALNADIKSIGRRAFAGSFIEEIHLPIALEHLGEEAFYDCDYLTDITLTGTITVIGPRTFQYSNNLKSVILPETVEKIGDEAFSGCAFKTFVVPEGVREIGSMAFAGCTQLESIVLPASLEKLGNGAFGNCPELKSVTFLGTEPPEMDSMGMAFSSVGMGATFYLPKSLSQEQFESFQYYVSMRGIQAGASWARSQ